jgi:hypothetical protein
MRTIFSVALVVVLSLALAAPVSAGRGSGGGFHGGFHGVPHGGFHHGFRQFGCCVRPAAVGGVVPGSGIAYPDSGYPSEAYPAYADPAYVPVPASQPQTQVPVAPSVQPGPEICYPSGCYFLHGAGGTGAYSWTWVPAMPTAPPASPTNSPRAR